MWFEANRVALAVHAVLKRLIVFLVDKDPEEGETMIAYSAVVQLEAKKLLHCRERRLHCSRPLLRCSVLRTRADAILK